MEPNDEDFTPRSYQIDLFEQALEKNCIIFLPTGSGKTFIAVQLIRKLYDSTQTPFTQGGKLTIFTVNTVPLVAQQSAYISRHLGVSCKGYSGEMQLDNWTDLEWAKEFDKYQVLVMTSQILCDLVSHGTLTFSQINLIIFDECHRAVNDHPMRQVMQLFKTCPVKDQPRILALTATLINSNVKLTKIDETVRALEVTFHAKVASVSAISDVEHYSTNPQEIKVTYKPYIPSSVEVPFTNIIDDATTVLNYAELRERTDYSSEVFKPQATYRKLQCILVDLKQHFCEMGIYGGYICAMLHYMQLEGLKRNSECKVTSYVLNYLTTAMVKIRKLFDDEMSGYSESERIYKFSSDQICKLLNLLKQINESKNADQKFCTIIFATKKISVQIIYYILKHLNEISDDFKFLLPSYMVGISNSPNKIAREALCISKWNNEALYKFRKGLLNCIVSTDILDEGVDVPSCLLVVRYDLPMDFRAYTQSKGRTRQKFGFYALLLSEQNTKYLKRHCCYQETQSRLQQLLIGKTNKRSLPSQSEIHTGLYDCEIKPYMVTSIDGTLSVVTAQSAISLINRYCFVLYKSIFVRLAPTWTLHTETNNPKTYYTVSLKLPNVSRLKETVVGDPMSSISSAKRSVAIKACELLHKMGELSDKLLPVDVNSIPHGIDVNYLFPNWMEEDEAEKHILGTYKKKRLHNIEYPKPLYGAFPQPEKMLYLHIIHSEPTYSAPHDNRHFTFYNLLRDRAGYAILSTKQMPQLPEFPIFMNVGELNVQLVPNYKTLTLKKNPIEHLKIFHSLIFNQIIPLIKVFMVFDTQNLDNCFLIVPVNHRWDIDWDTVMQYQTIERDIPTDLCHIKKSNYDLALVEPSYRSSVSVYVVTQVCDEITPGSSFPTDDFYSYAHYYKEKHRLTIRNFNQPMLEVKPISTNINCIRPRSMKPGMSKRKRANVLEDFDEHLVPELCVKVNFPTLYWLKATTLPSILHRISQLLVAEDLRITIVQEANLGELPVSKENKWSLLELSETEADEPGEPLLEVTYDENMDTSMPEPELNGPEVDVLDLDTNTYSWTKEQEPVDIYRCTDRITLLDIEYYHQFMAGTLDEDAESLKHKCKQINYITSSIVPVPVLHVLIANDANGPGSVQIMQALTSKLGHDIFDLERLETLGDSYLKFIVSLYLYHGFKTFNEGRLTALKGKIIGNRNLYYCGCFKNIPGRMKVDDFLPKSNFVPPAYSTLRMLQTLLVENNISANVLYEFTIPVNERFSGYITEGTKEQMQKTLLDWDKAESPTGMEHFLGVQTVADKVVADCVEALIGVYLKVMGPKGATSLLKWLGVLPNNIEIDTLLHSAPKCDTINEENLKSHLQMANHIEMRLGYKFKNRIYLLQALTHPSYIYNTLTESYQRLEFLGDAIIDFLITSYIYETCTCLSPGALTDLRSALVNNITLACLAVRYGLHTGLLSMSSELNDAIDKFLKFQEGRNHEVNDELLWVLLEEGECNMSEYVEVPKILGDLFESVIGAIYLDCGKSLWKTWEVVYTLMHKEIDTFSKNVPKQPVRVLYETQGARPTFMAPTVIDGMNSVVVPLEVTIAGKPKLFHGFGANKKQAKCAAAKQALKSIRCKK